MEEREIATALELMQGGLTFEHDADGWWWEFGDAVSDYCATEFTAVANFCQWFNSLKSAGTVFITDPQPAAFDIDALMMDGIEALCKAAAEEMRARGQELDAPALAGALASMWHIYSELRK